MYMYVCQLICETWFCCTYIQSKCSIRADLHHHKCSDNIFSNSDNYYSSGPLLGFLAKNYSIYVAANIKRNAKGFPESLKGLSVQKGECVCKKVGDVCYTLLVTIRMFEHLESPAPRYKRMVFFIDSSCYRLITNSCVV